MKKIPAAREIAVPVSLRDTRDDPDYGKSAAAGGLMRLTRKNGRENPGHSISRSSVARQA